MPIPLSQVDACTSRVYSGNPAAVCPLDDWLPDALLQAIVAENNLSVTAFFVPAPAAYALRWHTPVCEVDLCGHATLAAAHVLFTHLGCADEALHFATRSGTLTVRRHGDGLAMDFPARPPAASADPPALASDDYLAVFEDEATVRALQPDFSVLATLGRRGVIATAPGDAADFISRFFAPPAAFRKIR